MAFHHVVKFLINLLVFLLSIGGEDIGRISVGALAASVLLFVQGLWVKEKKKTGGSTELIKKHHYQHIRHCLCLPVADILHEATFFLIELESEMI